MPDPTDAVTPDRSTAERERGRRLRTDLPRSGHGPLVLPHDRDPVGVLERQHDSRLAGLVGVRVGRMLQSPFAYYRGTAAQMAADLAAGPTTDVRVVACGDAHLSNFGFFASPERSLLFDLNDFDEGAVAPWEWDVKRLAASVHVAGRDIGLDEDACRDATHHAVSAYQEALGELMELTALERFYKQVDTERIESAMSHPDDVRLTRKAFRKARRRTADRVLARITTRAEDGRPRIVDEPPVTRHVDHATIDELSVAFRAYLSTLREDTAVLLAQFELVDFVLRVVGVGSVGTRCYVLLFLGPSGEPFFLQAKEAQVSVLVSHGGMPDVVAGPQTVPVRSEGHRVVAAQRVLQAQSDPFLGWFEGWAGERSDRPKVDYYWRQFRDMKGSIDLATLDARQLARYAGMCALLLARAHSQSPTAHAVAGYLGPSGPFADAVTDWAAAYADVCEADFAALEAAVRAGRFPVEPGV